MYIYSPYNRGIYSLAGKTDIKHTYQKVTHLTMKKHFVNCYCVAFCGSILVP